MTQPLFFLTGFGPFEDVLENASQRLVEALLADPPEGVALAGSILPVSFRGSVEAIDAALAQLQPRRPALLFSMGVSGDSHFRFERQARLGQPTSRADNDGKFAEASPESSPPRKSSLPLEPLAERLSQACSGPVTISEDAGRYVCERVFYHTLGLGEALAVPALFLHVPRLERLGLERQFPAVRLLLAHLGSMVRQSQH